MKTLKQDGLKGKQANSLEILFVVIDYSYKFDLSSTIEQLLGYHGRDSVHSPAGQQFHALLENVSNSKQSDFNLTV